MKILVICGAGASSTFVALRIRRTAAGRGLTLEVSAASESDLQIALPGIDVVLVGPHLAPRFDEIRAQSGSTGVGWALLPASVFTNQDGSAALDLALAAHPAGNAANQT